mmetsp:Transcript_36906/g.93234  ORF Transcript_36906/g.93234 Transcript_36906/m.93234 type:complete len:212 (+) Transcript_36906:2104-2739(+)
MSLLQQTLQLSHLLVRRRHKRHLLLDLHLTLLQGRLDVLHLLLHALLLPHLPLALRLHGANVVLQPLDFTLQLQLIRLRGAQLVLQLHQLRAQAHNLIHLHVPLTRELLLLPEQLIHSGLLAQAQPCALLHQPSEVCNLQLQLLDGLFCTCFLLVACVYHFPRLLDFLLQSLDGVLVLLAELQCCLHLGSIRNNLRIQLPALLDEPFLALM